MSLQCKEKYVNLVVCTITDLIICTSVYLDKVTGGSTSWPASVIVDGVPDIENVSDALRNGPYGKCVYESENDVCDNQVSNTPFFLYMF